MIYETFWAREPSPRVSPPPPPFGPQWLPPININHQWQSIISTARCSSSRNSLRGITHSPSPHFGGGATSSFDGIFFYKTWWPGFVPMRTHRPTYTPSALWSRSLRRDSSLRPCWSPAQLRRFLSLPDYSRSQVPERQNQKSVTQMQVFLRPESQDNWLCHPGKMGCVH